MQIFVYLVIYLYIHLFIPKELYSIFYVVEMIILNGFKVQGYKQILKYYFSQQNKY